MAGLRAAERIRGFGLRRAPGVPQGVALSPRPSLHGGAEGAARARGGPGGGGDLFLQFGEREGRG